MTERFSSAGVGFVCIVGVGTGPMHLMTLRALNRLRNADVVLHDRLDSTEVLDQIQPQAQRLYVGKALGDHAVPQQGIHALLVAHLRLGSRVVRLKGGHPYVLGRGGEVVRALQAEGIAFEVMPGVTAASGCSAMGWHPAHRPLSCATAYVLHKR